MGFAKQNGASFFFKFAIIKKENLIVFKIRLLMFDMFLFSKVLRQSQQRHFEFADFIKNRNYQLMN